VQDNLESKECDFVERARITPSKLSSLFLSFILKLEKLEEFRAVIKTASSRKDQRDPANGISRSPSNDQITRW